MRLDHADEKNKLMEETKSTIDKFEKQMEDMKKTHRENLEKTKNEYTRELN